MQSLYLSYDGMTDQLGQSQVIPYLQKLTERGHKFTLISFEKPEQLVKHQAATTDLLNKIGIEWIPMKYHKWPPVLSTLWDFLWLMKKTHKLCKSKPIEVVHCRSYVTAIVGLTLKKKRGIKFIFDMRGFWADERNEGKIWNLKNPIYKFLYQFFKRKEKQLLQGADHVIALTETARDIIHTWKLSVIPPITVIPCCADTNHFNRSTINATDLHNLRFKLGLKNEQFVIGYLGAIGTWYMLNEMLDFFKVLMQSKPEARFLFVTNEPAETILHTASEKGIAPESIVISSASRNEVPLYIMLMSISIYFIKPTFSKQASSPTKMAELLSMGIPVICNSGIGDSDRIIEKTEAGILVDEMSDNSYYAAILKINNLLQKDPVDLRQTALDYFSLEMGAERYNTVYKSLSKIN